jgi:hypothetical protein
MNMTVQSRLPAEALGADHQTASAGEWLPLLDLPARGCMWAYSSLTGGPPAISWAQET